MAYKICGLGLLLVAFIGWLMNLLVSKSVDASYVPDFWVINVILGILVLFALLFYRKGCRETTAIMQ